VEISGSAVVSGSTHWVFKPAKRPIGRNTRAIGRFAKAAKIEGRGHTVLRWRLISQNSQTKPDHLRRTTSASERFLV